MRSLRWSRGISVSGTHRDPDGLGVRVDGGCAANRVLDGDDARGGDVGRDEVDGVPAARARHLHAVDADLGGGRGSARHRPAVELEAQGDATRDRGEIDRLVVGDHLDEDAARTAYAEACSVLQRWHYRTS